MVASAGSTSPRPAPCHTVTVTATGTGTAATPTPANEASQAEGGSTTSQFVPDNNEIVISGISGRFPESADMNEFMDNLLHGVNMVTVNERRFKPGLYGIPHGFGTLKEIDKFDADAFGMLPNQVKKTDPGLRIMLETVYEAMCDAGVNPADQRGSRTGVFLGLCTAESLTLLSSDPNRIDGLALIGCSASMFANRVSYSFDFKGPSCAYDTACSTSAFALEAAVSSMRAGKCDAAIVTASTLILTPTGNVQFDRLGMLSKDGACKSFDAAGDGFARAETVATIYLQRTSVAKRAYASILHIKTNTDGYKDNGITYPSAGMQEELLREVYRELGAVGISKGEVTYVEAHGTGTAAGDPQELAAISKIFRPRGVGGAGGSPLLVGSVKSNMGHAEGVSGLCSIAKVVVMLQSGLIPANLHYKEPSYRLNSIRSGAIEVVDSNLHWNCDSNGHVGLVAVNSFGFGGVNVHFVLKPYGKVPLPLPTISRLPASNGSLEPKTGPNGRPTQARLVLFSGRNEAGVAHALKKIIEARNPNLCLLTNEMCRNPNSVSTVRGFAIWNDRRSKPEANETPEDSVHHVQRSPSISPPVWFVFNGIGSQWIGMCRDLLQLHTFAQSIETSAKTLMTKFNFDLHALLTTADSEAYENPTNCFVGITACQIGLVDVLHSLGLRPAGFLGHSAGEMVCAYLDGCLTAEETIICAYLRGESLAAVRSHSEPGAMAVVGLPWPQVEKMCSPGVYPACHNGLDSVTVSGLQSAMAAFVQELKDKKKGVTPVKSCGVAFHSPYIAKASRSFLTSLRAQFKRPVLARSSSWVSTSVPESEWSSSLGLTASPEYFVNNFLSPVLFYEGLQHVPQGSVVIEVGPSGLLRGLVKKACPTCTVVPLQSRDSKDGLGDLLAALGKVYLAGVNFDANKLVEPSEVQFPVPLGTPFLSPLVAGAWNHSTSWEVPYFGMNGSLQQTRFEIDLCSEADSYLAGHVVQGRILFPATGYLVLVWKHFALTRQLDFESCPIVFENVRFNRVTVLGRRDKVEFRIHISDTSGEFEIKEGGAVVASGTVRAPDSNPGVAEMRIGDQEFIEIEKEEVEKLEIQKKTLLDGASLYKRFRFYGFEYGGLFRGIRRCDQIFRSCVVGWAGNWTAFLDTLLQTYIRPFEPSPKVKVPTAITKLVINPGELLKQVTKVDVDEVLLYTDPDLGLVKCHGVEMHWPKMTTVNRRGKEAQPELFSVKFTPYFDTRTGSQSTTLEPAPGGTSPMLLCVSVALENLPNRFSNPEFKLRVIEASPTEADLQESVAVERLIRLTFGVMDMDYTIFAGHNSDPEPEPLEAGGEGSPRTSTLAHSGIDLKSFDDFHKDTWLDKTYDIIILHNHVFLVVIAGQYLKKGKFLILKLRRQDEVTPEGLVEKIGPKMNIVAVKYSGDGQYVVYLIRKVSTKPKMGSAVEIPISSRDTGWVPELRAAIRDQENQPSKSKRIYLTSTIVNEYDSGICGLLACLRKEPFSESIRMIFCKTDHNSPKLKLDFGNPTPQLARILQHDLTVNIFNEHGRWGFYSICNALEFKSGTHERTLTRSVESAFVGMGKVGDLSTLRWIEGISFKSLGTPPEYVPIDVHFAALNFKDIMLATGSLPTPDTSAACPYNIESPLGLEFSGTTAEGKRVCGYNEGQSIATHVLAHEAQLWEVPARWSLAEAATVPVVYATVYLALVERGRIRTGDSILIHSGAGGVGQAAIRVALSKNCTVFTTVGSDEKRDFLRQTFPAIPESHIGNSRDTRDSFENMVLRLTKGRGVNLVLNSLSGEKLEASVRCLARHGRFLEIGKFDLVANKALGMELFLKDASFHGVMLDSLWDEEQSTLARLRALVQEGIDTGVVQPLPARVFQTEAVEPAFRYMGTGKHVGKILIQIRKDSGDGGPQEGPEPFLHLDASPRVYFNPSAVYIVVGGLGGIGLEFVNWMIGRYARRIVITSRTGIKTAYQSEYIRAWRERARVGDPSVRVEVVTYDASRLDEAEALLKFASSLGPIDGFFNLAMHLELGHMKDQTATQFEAAMAPKVTLCRNMDLVTSQKCPEMSHFVVFSSIIASVGMPGQTNYGLANSGAEQICERRARDGLAGKAVQLGPISEVGHFHEMYHHREGGEESRSRAFGGMGVQTITSVLQSLDALLTVPDPVVGSRVHRELVGGKNSGAGGSFTGDSLPDRLSHILGTDISKLNPKTRLTELGLDSIMAMEVRQVLEQEFGLHLSATEIRTVSLEQLQEQSKNSEKNVINPAKMKPRTRAATADLFQFNFMRNSKKARILYKQCVHPINKRTLNEKTSDQGTIFVCNSVEGPHILRILGSLLKRVAYSMQIPEDGPLDSLDAFVGFYHEQLKATQPCGPYVLAGYSAGALVAIELALRLQADGDEVKNLVLIDLTPGRADALFEENFGSERASLDDTHVLIAILSQVLNIDKAQAEAVIWALPDRETRIQKAVELGSALFDEEVDFRTLDKLLGESQLKIMNFFNHYKPSGTYHGKVSLVRTTQNLVSYDSNEYWGLEEFCSQIPSVHIIESTHSYLVAEPGVHKVAAVINTD